MNLAIAAGHELMVVHGRDRKLSLDAVRQAEVRPAASTGERFLAKRTTIGGATSSARNIIRQGKNLIVTGQNFGDGSTIMVNGEDRRIIFDSSTSLIGKKVGKTIQPGDKVRVRNPDGLLSNEVTYSPP